MSLLRFSTDVEINAPRRTAKSPYSGDVDGVMIPMFTTLEFRLARPPDVSCWHSGDDPDKHQFEHLYALDVLRQSGLCLRVQPVPVGDRASGTS